MYMDSNEEKNEKQNENNVFPKDETASESSDDSEEEFNDAATNSTNPQDPEINHWVREITDDAGRENEEIVESLDNTPVKKGDLPDWINELSPKTEEPFDLQENLLDEEELTKSAPFDSKEKYIESQYEQEDFDGEEGKDSLVGDDPHDDGFIEISEYDMNEDVDAELTPNSFEGPDEKQEELPDWLKEMIAEEQKLSEEQIKKASVEATLMSDEPTKPVPVSETSTTEELEEEKIDDQAAVAPSLNLDEIAPENDQLQADENIHIIDFEDESEITEEVLQKEPPASFVQELSEISDLEEFPILIEESADSEVILIEDTEWEQHDHLPLSFPKALRFAKYLLDQGKIDPAYEIFQNYIAKSEHLPEIKAWVTEAKSEEQLSKSKLWEILGDIAQKQHDHVEALSAYTKSISFLLKKE